MLKHSNSLSSFGFDFKPRSYICNLSTADLFKGLNSCKFFIRFTGNDYLCMSGIILWSCVTYKGTYLGPFKISYSTHMPNENGSRTL